MTTSQDIQLTHKKLQKLINIAAKRFKNEEVEVESQDFDFNVPHHFSPHNMKSFELFGKKIEQNLAQTLNSLCQNEFEITIQDVNQQFTNSMKSQVLLEQQNHYFLPYNIGEKQQGGYLNIDFNSALTLVGYMLRDPDFVTGEDRQLSKLEDSILYDVSSAVIDSIADNFKIASGLNIQKDQRFIKGDWPLKFSGLDDMFNINLLITNPEGSSFELTFTILSTLMEPILGVEPIKAPESPEQLTKIIMKSMNDVPIEISARIESAYISLNDVMNLSSGDILMLHKKTSEPLEVLLNDRLCFYAHAAACKGRYALVIAPPPAD